MEEENIDKILTDIIGKETISAEEKAFLEEWQQKKPANKRFVISMLEMKQAGEVLKNRQTQEQVFRRIASRIRLQKRKRLQRFSIAAAVVVTLLLVGGQLWLKNSTTQETPVLSPITPGKFRAELVLSNGEVITLDSLGEKTIAENIRVNRKQNLLIYDRLKETTEKYHTIRVPRGGEYNLILADGTKVYLNAGSSLHYPVHFSKGKRQVRLTGEGYFEVARDTSCLFIVQAGEVAVNVLGTTFNVNAYPENSTVTTTLVQGEVEVNYGKGKDILEPGTQLVFDQSNGHVQKRNVDTEVYTSWKDGYYYFKQETLENIMSTLERWYDVHVFFQNETLKDIKFGGRLRRYDNITYLLDQMEKTQDVKFTIKGNTITITQKTD